MDDGWKEYESKEYGIRMKYPDFFVFRENQLGTVVLFNCSRDPLHTSLNVIVEPVADGTDLKEFSKPIEEMATKGGMAGVQREMRIWDATLFQQEAKRMSFVTSVPVPTGGTMDVKVFQTWSIIGNQAFIVTFTSPEETHSEYREVVEKMLFSMRNFEGKRGIKSLFFANYENDKHMFRMRYVWGGWKKDESKDESGSVVMFTYEGPLSPVDKESVYLSTEVTVQDVPEEDVDLEMYSVLHGMQVMNLASDGKSSKEKTKMGGIDAYKVQYCSNVNIEDGKILQVYCVKDGKIYTITCSHNATDDRPVPLFQRQISSFEFLEKGYKSKMSYMTYENLQYGASFDFTSKWKVSEGFFNTLVAFEREDATKGASNTCNVNLVVTEVDVEMEEFKDILQEQLKSSIQDAKVVEEGRVDIGGREGYRVISTGKIPPQELKTEQRFLIVDGKAYIISLSVLKHLFDTERPHATPLMDSFKFFDV